MAQIEEILRQTQQMQFGLSPNNINLTFVDEEVTSLPLGKYYAFQVLSETASFTSIFENEINKTASQWGYGLTKGAPIYGDFGSLDPTKLTTIASGTVRFYAYNSEKV